LRTYKLSFSLIITIIFLLLLLLYIARYTMKINPFPFPFSIYMLNQPISKCIIVQQIVIFAIILCIIPLTVQSHIIVSEEEIHCFNSCQIFITNSLISPKDSLLSLNLNFLQHLDIFLPQKTLSLIPGAIY